VVVQIGAPTPPPDLRGLLMECHERIRRFTLLACTIGVRPDGRPEDLHAMIDGVERYFTEALPLHVADEDQSLLPRLRGLDPALDVALERMSTEHASHLAPLDELLAALRRVRATPGDAEAHAHLIWVAGDLEASLLAHLRHEEAEILPAIDRLDAATQAEIVAELRARRRA
jgi:hemerythrin-like domain-containing protein